MVVGTGAPQRREIASRHFGDNYELVFMTPGIDEKQIRHSDRFELTRGISNAKLDALLTAVEADAELKSRVAARSGSVAVTFDQVVDWEDETREKPESKEEAAAFIQSYSNDKVGTVMTTALYCFTTEKRSTQSNVTMTYYRDIPKEAIDRIVDRGVCANTAGAFVVEDEDMKKSLIRIEPGTEDEVRGFCPAAIHSLIKECSE